MRENNEDALYIPGKLIQERKVLFEEKINNRSILLLAADGMGGHEQGELASRQVLESISKMLDSSRKMDHTSVEEALSWARQSLERTAMRHPDANNMGTTVAGIWLGDEQSLVFNVGDTRAYIYSQDCLQRLTKDHSYIWEKVEKGELTEEEARTSPGKSRLMSAITVWSNPLESGYFIRPIQCVSGAIYLLCTDGLWETMSSKDMEECFRESKSLKELSGLLQEKASASGLKDNLSFILAQIF